MRLIRWWCNYFHERAPRRMVEHHGVWRRHHKCLKCGTIHPEFL
jgi:hypothetical protein